MWNFQVFLFLSPLKYFFLLIMCFLITFFLHSSLQESTTPIKAFFFVFLTDVIVVFVHVCGKYPQKSFIQIWQLSKYVVTFLFLCLFMIQFFFMFHL